MLLSQHRLGSTRAIFLMILGRRLARVSTRVETADHSRTVLKALRTGHLLHRQSA